MMRRIAACLSILAANAAVAGDSDHALTLWRSQGTSNSIYLLGSVHLLREEDHPLHSAIDAAYDDADVVVMELDMDDLDPAKAQAAFRRAGVLTDGTTLRDLMGEEPYAQAEKAAAAVDVPLDMLAQSEPWLAAITVELMALYRIGFNPLYGVEMTITNRATSDGKPIEGLETVDEQLAFLDGLPLEAQREMLLQTLTGSAALPESIDGTIEAWHHGDVQALERDLLSAIREQPELHAALLVDRNRRWAEAIAGWIGDDRDYLVVVGALHLVGDEGVPALLEEKGIGIHQLSHSEGLR
ncbi:MAG: TraB/GumN family protein [Proteobacteria bacterium]|nr:TraB/GumN family protein [Pseudomonadota bacterium]